MSVLLLSNMLMFAYTAIKLYQRQQFIRSGMKGTSCSAEKKQQFAVSFISISTAQNVPIELCDGWDGALDKINCALSLVLLELHS